LHHLRCQFERDWTCFVNWRRMLLPADGTASVGRAGQCMTSARAQLGEGHAPQPAALPRSTGNAVGNDAPIACAVVINKPLQYLVLLQCPRYNKTSARTRRGARPRRSELRFHTRSLSQCRWASRARSAKMAEGEQHLRAPGSFLCSGRACHAFGPPGTTKQSCRCS
jgi:hypothetical protein